MARKANVTCKECGEDDPTKFGKRKSGNRIYPRHLCKVCHNRKRTERRLKEMRDPVSKLGLKYKERNNLRQRIKRQNNVANAILTDSRRSDKKCGRDNDLDLSFVQSAIDGDCLYCGENKLRMTLDRIDNGKGHTKNNVITACVRCNYLRRDMPFKAWLYLLDALKKARLEGLLDGWVGGIKKTDWYRKDLQQPVV